MMQTASAMALVPPMRLRQGIAMSLAFGNGDRQFHTQCSAQQFEMRGTHERTCMHVL